MASAYDLSPLYGAGDFGQGETVGLIELESYSATDIQQYQACYGTNVPISCQPVPVTSECGSGPGIGEAALDIEDVIGLAPEASILVYEGTNIYDVYSQAISDDFANVISTSLYLCEPYIGLSEIQMESTLFMQAAMQGQSVFAASGDDGSAGCDNVSNGYAGDADVAVSDPSSQPYVTGVGGTTIETLGPPPSETTWNNCQDQSANCATDYATTCPATNGVTCGGASGGGVSQEWSMPTYQADAPASLNVTNSDSSPSPCAGSPLATGAGDCREVPDVSADADADNSPYAIYWNGEWRHIAGTSAAAPLWAAGTAVIDSDSSCGPVGFLNPALYQIAGGPGYSSALNDITSGNSSFTDTNLDGGFGGSDLAYPATPGYDMATGLGSPNFDGLATALAALCPWSAQSTVGPSGASGYTLSGVSCTSSAACTAVGDFTSPSNVGAALAEVRNGTTWSVQPTRNPPIFTYISTLSGVSCTSPTACTAVGEYEKPVYLGPADTLRAGVDGTLAENWNGTRWSVESTPTPTGWRSSNLTSVSCTSATTCTAVGGYVPPNEPPMALAEVWNGKKKWKVEFPPNPAGSTSYLSGVSCTSATACTAVGEHETGAGDVSPLAEIRTGSKKWKVEFPPNPAGSMSYLSGVSCTSATACTAVGEYENSVGGIGALVETRNGTSWSVQYVPSPPGWLSSALTGVSCTSSTACTAVGNYYNSADLPEDLTEIWNGTSWSVQANLPVGPLSSVSCTSASACTAVGGDLAEARM